MWYVFWQKNFHAKLTIEQLQRLNFLILLHRLLAIALLVIETLSSWLTSVSEICAVYSEHAKQHSKVCVEEGMCSESRVWCKTLLGCVYVVSTFVGCEPGNEAMYRE